MKDLAIYLLSHIVEHTENIDVTEQIDESGAITLLLHVAKEDMGRVIGKNGKIIQSLRNLIKVRALKENKLVNVVLAE